MPGNPLPAPAARFPCLVSVPDPAAHFSRPVFVPLQRNLLIDKTLNPGLCPIWDIDRKASN